jgi:uncharacterized protein
LIFSILGLPGLESLVVLWLIILSLIAVVMMGVDKSSAKARKGRIRESTFGTIALLGGYWGVVLGGIVFHHKTSKPKFWAPVGLALVVWTVLFLVLFGAIRL